MSKHDFAAWEFDDRLSRVRAEMASRHLDWLVAIHPTSIHWLTGSDAKSYQEFQCLLIGAGNQPLTAFVRAGEVNELEADSITDEVVGWGGGVSDDPIRALEPVIRRLGVVGSRVGLEVPGFYLHPYQYLTLVELLGRANVEDATSLVADLKLVKSATEIGYIREAARLADAAMAEFEVNLRSGKTELELAGRIYEFAARGRQRNCREPNQSRFRAAQCIQPWGAHDTSPPVRRFWECRVWSSSSTLHLDAWTTIRAWPTDPANARALRGRPPCFRCNDRDHS